MFLEERRMSVFPCFILTMAINNLHLQNFHTTKQNKYRFCYFIISNTHLF